MTEIVLKNIFKSYDQTEVIHGVDLKVENFDALMSKVRAIRSAMSDQP